MASFGLMGPERVLPIPDLASVALVFDGASITELIIRLYIQTLRGMEEYKGLTIGTKDLFGNPGAILMEMTSPAAAAMHYDSMDELVFVTPRVALLQTSESKENWENILTAANLQSPMTAISKMLYRASNRGGRPFAEPQALGEELRAKKAQARVAAVSKQEQARRTKTFTINIQEFNGKGREEIARLIIDAIKNKAKVQFDEGLDMELKEGEWKMVRNAEGNWNGKLLVHAKSLEEVQMTMKEIYGTAVEADGRSHTIEISSEHVSHPRRGAR